MQALRRAFATAALGLVVAACNSSSSETPSPTDGAAATSAPSSTAVPSASNATSTPTIAPTPAPIVVAAAYLEPALKQLWQVGGPKPPKDGACCVTIAPDGNVWASTGFGSSFWIVDPDGKFLESWGGQGTGEGQFDFIVKSNGYGAIAFDPDGTFYVADTANHRVQKFDKNRQFVTEWGTFGTDDGQFATPAAIATDARGNVYVGDWDRHDVQMFTSNGAFVRTLALDNLGYFIAVDMKGRLYVDDGPIIRVFDADGTQLPGFDLSSTGWYAGGMTFDAAGNVYVPLITTYGPGHIETKAIYEIDPSGKLLHAWPGQADSLAVDSKGSSLYSSFYAEPLIRKLALPTP